MNAECFVLPARLACGSLPELGELSLRTATAEALAEVLPILVCGEESAALAFGSLAKGIAAEAATALHSIAIDELQHECLLRQLKAALPQPTPDSHLQAVVRLFFVSMADRDPGRHFAKVVALDSAVCGLLGVLRAAHAPLMQDEQVNRILARIHRDEARHVRVARSFMSAAIDLATARAVALEARERLIAVLALRAAAFEALGVDVDRLFSRLRALPTALFS